MTYGTAEYIREHVWEECPDYSFPRCEYGHTGCSCTDEEGGWCIDEVEAEADHRINLRMATGIINNIVNHATWEGRECTS